MSGVYQLNVIAPALATDRIYLRSGGFQSNIVYMGIQAGSNALNVSGSIDGLSPSGDPNYPRVPCSNSVPSSIPCGSGALSGIVYFGC
jgi:hypothetical protein